jgi:hypothetical protein
MDVSVTLKAGEQSGQAFTLNGSPFFFTNGDAEGEGTPVYLNNMPDGLGNAAVYPLSAEQVAANFVAAVNHAAANCGAHGLSAVADGARVTLGGVRSITVG